MTDSAYIGVGRLRRPYLTLPFLAPVLFFLSGTNASTETAGVSGRYIKHPAPGIIASAALERLRIILPKTENAANCQHASQPAGRYSAETPELAGKMGGGGYLSGDSLYLFRNGSFLYTEWADISPVTIMESGRWSLRTDLIELAPDGSSLGKSNLHDASYVVFCLPSSGRRELRIIGSDFQLRKLEEHYRENPGGADRQFLVMLYSRERQEEYATQQASRRAMEGLRHLLPRSIPSAKPPC